MSITVPQVISLVDHGNAKRWQRLSVVMTLIFCNNDQCFASKQQRTKETCAQKEGRVILGVFFFTSFQPHRDPAKKAHN